MVKRIGDILGMVGDMKQKAIVSIGFRASYVTSPFDLTHDLDLGFEIAVSQRYV